jgi:hypothetical protein
MRCATNFSGSTACSSGSMLGAVQHFLHTHFEDGVGMGADHDAFGGDVPQHRIEDGPALPHS